MTIQSTESLTILLILYQQEGSPTLSTADIYTLLRDEIVQGKLNPGERLVEKNLCERLGASRGYVREALKLLGADGFVKLSHGKGATVVKISPQEVKDLYEVLAVLEAKSVELAAPHLDISDIERLTTINAAMKGCIDSKDRIFARTTWQEENFRFHRIFEEKSGNNELRDMLESVRWRAFDFRYVYFFEQHFDLFSSQHTLMIEAIQEKAYAKARRIMEDHVEKASDVVLRSLEYVAGF